MKSLQEILVEKLKIDKDIYVDNSKEKILEILMSLSQSSNNKLKAYYNDWLHDNNVSIVKIWTSLKATKKSLYNLEKLQQDVKNKVEVHSFGDFMEEYYKFFKDAKTLDNGKNFSNNIVISSTDKSLLISKEDQFLYLVIKRKTIYDD